MNQVDFFRRVPARQFFTNYAPRVKRYYHKMRGVDGNKRPITFTPEDKADMQYGLQRMIDDLKKVRF